MFRHKSPINQTAENKKVVEETDVIPAELPVNSENKMTLKSETSKTESATIKELLEKNLKWSQIIYEQNRKINNKLMWSAVASWLRTFLILIPLILAILFLPAFIRGLQDTYGSLLGNKTTSVTPNINSIEQLLKILPLDPAKQEQLKMLLK